MRLPTPSLTVDAAWCGQLPPFVAPAQPQFDNLRLVSEKPAVLSVVAGLSDSGDEVIALLDQPTAPSRGDRVTAAAAFTKPRGLGYGSAAQLMLPLLTACVAIETAGVAEAVARCAPERPRVVVAGSTGRLPAMLVQLLHERGADALVAGRSQDADVMRRMGAAAALDHNTQDWASLYGEGGGRLHAVLDTLGCEESPELIEEYLDAKYVSLAPPPLRALVEDGAVAALRRRWQPEPPGYAWLPDEPMLASLGEALRHLDEGALTAPREELGGQAAELASQYAEYIGWKRDGDTGKRLGFPGRDLWAPAAPSRGEFVSAANRASDVKSYSNARRPPNIYVPEIEMPDLPLPPF